MSRPRRSGGAGDAGPGDRSGLEASRRDRAAAALTNAVAAVVQAGQRVVDVDEVTPGLLQQRADASAFKGDRGTFWVVLVIGRDVTCRLHDLPDIPGQCIDPPHRRTAVDEQRGSDVAGFDV